ncbi:MAG: AAA family ATPase [Phycisphaerae bacterium]
MIERLYIDNFRTLVNEEVKLGRTNLLLGGNGSGKSSVFAVVSKLQRLISGNYSVLSCFPTREMTRWDTRPDQVFELDLRNEVGAFHYRVQVQHDRARHRARITQESLQLDGKPIFSFVDGMVQLYNDYFTKGPSFPFGPEKSGLSVVNDRHDNIKLTRFKKDLQAVLIIQPNPIGLSAESRSEDDSLEYTGSNFVSWYRFISRQDIGRQHQLFDRLKDVLSGFSSFSIRGSPEAPAIMTVSFKPEEPDAKEAVYGLDELSDGQRVLLILYTLLYGMAGEKWSLFIDEPDNFVGLHQVQPWLTAALDAAGENIEQLVLISHNPEIINYMAQSKGIWLSRKNHGATRVEYQPNRTIAGISTAEAVARGLVD